MENWDDIQYFLAVARSGKISTAAVNLGVNHSTVSRRISAFEERLGLRLFHRLTTGFALTEAASGLIESAEEVERGAHRFTRSANSRDSRLSGRLVITSTSVLIHYVLMPIAMEFKKLYPEIKLQFSASEKIANLVNREADIAIRVTAAPLETLIGTRLSANENALYCAQGYLTQHGLTSDTAIKRKDLNWVARGTKAAERSWQTRYFPTGSMSCHTDSIATAIAAALAGMGVVELPRLIGDAENDLTRLQGCDLKSDRDVWILFHRDLRHTARVRAFVTLVRQKFGQLPEEK